MIMSRCFTWFPISGQENPIYNINRVVLQELGMTYGEGFLIMINYIYNQLNNLQGWFVIVSDCEEFVGVTYRR